MVMQARGSSRRGAIHAILVLALAGSLGWGCAGDSAGGEQGQEAVAEPGPPGRASNAEAAPAAATGLPAKAPDFVLPDVDGRPFRFAETAGQVRLVDFWATWCRPCIEEIPMFKELQETYGPQGFMLIAISLDDGGADVVRPFVERYGLPYVNLIGNEEVAQKFGGIFGFPTAFLVDRDGRIVERFIGPKPRRVLERKIRELLGQESEAAAGS